MKKLPNLYKNLSINTKTHNKDYCYLEDNQEENNKEIIEFIKNSNIYQIPLIITTKDNTFVTRIIKIENDNLITLKNEKIRIEDIIKIEK
ncbi:MAG: hypothetical protein IKE70_02395 [Bacilli bacterium]|nr:hypothetical protein [Bacilli bacterium]